MPRPLYPLNDFQRQAPIVTVDPITGVSTPATTGTFTGMITSSDAPDAGAADPSWSVSAVYIGGANEYDVGMWQWTIDGAALTVDKCRTAFAGSPPATPYFVAIGDGDFRAVEKLKYEEVRKATTA